VEKYKKRYKRIPVNKKVIAMKVGVFSTKYYERNYLNQANSKAQHQLTFFNESLNSTTVRLAFGFDAVCVLLNDTIDRKVVEELSKIGVKLIDLRSAGYDNVDIIAAFDHHIKVTRVSNYSPEAIAEHAVALILTLNRKTHKAYNRVKENNFSLQNLIGFSLKGKTVGVIGTGNIGSAICDIMVGFGCKVIAYDIVESNTIKAKGISYCSLVNLVQDSDIVSIHCPLTKFTKHLFNASIFNQMKKGAMLINTSRGGVINTVDAIDALKTGQLGYLGIDVYEGERDLFFKDLSESVVQDDLIERLMSFGNVLITPHLGFFTKEALEQIAITTIQNFTDFQNGSNLTNEITPK
jgi:D-lactate dehydrogenase